MWVEKGNATIWQFVTLTNFKKKKFLFSLLSLSIVTLPTSLFIESYSMQNREIEWLELLVENLMRSYPRGKFTINLKPSTNIQMYHPIERK